QGDVRFDDNVTDSDQIFGRGSYVHQGRVIPAPLPGIAGGGDYGTGDTTRETWGAAAGYSKTFTERTFNEFCAGFNQLSTSVGVPIGGPLTPPPSHTRAPPPRRRAPRSRGFRWTRGSMASRCSRPTNTRSSAIPSSTRR